MTMHNSRPAQAGRHGFFSSIKLSQLICLLAVIMIVIPLVTHYYISNMPADTDGNGNGHRTRKQLDHDEISSSKVADLRFQIEELKRIKASVLNELRELESRRQKLHSEISGYNTHIEQLKSMYEKTHVELEQLKITIDNSRLEQEELIKRTMPEVRAPSRILPMSDDGVYIPPPTSHIRCRMHSCFDYSRCSLTSQFPVYLYNPDEYSFSQSQLESFIKLSVRHAFDTSPHITIDPNIACVYIVLIGDVEGGLRNTSSLQKKLHSLPYWHGDGRNHVLLNMARYYSNIDVFEDVNIGRAMIVQSGFTDTTFRDKFDIVIPPSLGISHGDVWEQLHPVSPARRKHLLSFQGEFSVALDKFKLSGAELLQIDGMQGHVENWDTVKIKPDAHQDGLKVANQVLDKIGFGNKNNGRKEGAINLDNGAQVEQQFHEEREEHYEQEEDDEGDNNAPGDHEVFDRDQQQAEVRKDSAAALPPADSEEEKHQFRRLKAKDDGGVRVRHRAGGAKVHHRSATTQRQRVEELLSQEASVVQTLKRMQALFPGDGFYFEFQCHGERIAGINGEWALCGPDTQRHATLEQSTFNLIIAPTNASVVSTVLTQVRLYESLKHGAIPVILGEYTYLPFAELFAWKRAAVILPKARVTELHLFIRSVSDGDILEMRRQGRIIWERYCGTTHSIVNTMLAVLRTRLQIPAYPVREEPAPSVFNSSFVPLREDVADSLVQSEDVLGPIESPLPSLRYHRNFTQLEDPFDLPGDPFHSYPFTPFEPLMPGEAKFMGSGLGFRPIGKGAGGAGKEFSEALGGNLPREQFTIVILTYEREAVLLNALSRLKGLPHLNKVLVVWNNPRPPADDLHWPNIGVHIHVVRTAKNSLNNRFLPYDAIETEAVLSIDDDAHLRHDEIMFGFRVWRENRERVVGFPGRFHSWDLKQPGWTYNSNYSCELSMVLTGAAFYHKYYAYLYSHVMPQAIRDKVDEYLNCEDIAMNFLVAHITRKPPIKVTSRWTFRCPGCSNALSVEDSHFNERHKCINFFTKVYGYMPLLYTQFRVDSVLFKTRIPHDRQKCFKFI